MPQPQGLAGSLKACFVYHSHFERAVTALPETPDLSMTPVHPPTPHHIPGPDLMSAGPGRGRDKPGIAGCSRLGTDGKGGPGRHPQERP